MKEYKCISHIERMQNAELSKCSVVKQVVEPRLVSVDEKKLVDGHVCAVSTRVTKDPRDYVKKFKVSDFSIENLTAAGAVNNLKVVNLSGDVITSIDNAVAGLDSLAAIELDE